MFSPHEKRHYPYHRERIDTKNEFNMASHPILTPGMQIESITGGGEGTIGCFARKTVSPNELVVLSNSHVLFGDTLGVSGPFKIYHPNVGSTCCRGWNIGKTVGQYSNSNHTVRSSYSFQGESGTNKGSDVDCAIATIDGDVSFNNNVPKIGMITGVPPAGSLGVAAGDRVRKVGITTGLTSGKILDLSHLNGKDASNNQPLNPVLCPIQISGGGIEDELAGAFPNINFFVILPDDGKADFVGGGDSGAAVVNDARQVIGLIFRKIILDARRRVLFKLTDPKFNKIKTLGVACPIHPVLNQMKIEIPPNFSRTVPSQGTSLEWQQQIIYYDNLDKVRKTLLQSKNGKLLLGLMRRHRPECMKMIMSNMTAEMYWQTVQGPAYVAHFVRNIEDSSHKIPGSINNVSQEKVVNMMKSLLLEHGSDRLKLDIIKYGLPFIENFNGIDDVWTFHEMLEKINLNSPELEQK